MHERVGGWCNPKVVGTAGPRVGPFLARYTRLTHVDLMHRYKKGPTFLKNDWFVEGGVEG